MEKDDMLYQIQWLRNQFSADRTKSLEKVEKYPMSANVHRAEARVYKHVLTLLEYCFSELFEETPFLDEQKEWERKIKEERAKQKELEEENPSTGVNTK